MCVEWNDDDDDDDNNITFPCIVYMQYTIVNGKAIGFTSLTF